MSDEIPSSTTLLMSSKTSELVGGFSNVTIFQSLNSPRIVAHNKLCMCYYIGCYSSGVKGAHFFLVDFFHERNLCKICKISHLHLTSIGSILK